MCWETLRRWIGLPRPMYQAPQLQEEDFVQPLSIRTSQSRSSSSTQSRNRTENVGKPSVNSQQNKGSTVQSHLVFEESRINNQEQGMEFQRNDSEKLQSQEDKEQVMQFAVDLESLDPYFNLITERTYNLKQYLQVQGQPLLSQVDFSLEEVKEARALGFLIRSRVSCTFAQFRQTINDTRLQPELSSQIAQVKVLQQLKPNLSVCLMRFNRIGALDQREFVFVYYERSIDDCHWQIAISINHNSPDQGFKRCDLFSARFLRERDGELEITQRVTLNLGSQMATNILKRLTQPIQAYFQQMKKFLTKSPPSFA